MTDVVTGSPSLNELDPLIKPEIVLSLFNFHLEIVGIPLCALTAVEEGAVLLETGGNEV